MRHHLVQHLIGAAVMGVCVAGAGSEQASGSGDLSIESAKREFDTLRDSTGLSSESQLRLPQIQWPSVADKRGALIRDGSHAESFFAGEAQKKSAVKTGCSMRCSSNRKTIRKRIH